MSGGIRRLALPPRYAAIVVGSLLLLISSDGAVLLRGPTATPWLGLGALLAGLLGMGCLLVAVWRHGTIRSEDAAFGTETRARAGWLDGQMAPGGVANTRSRVLRYLLLALAAALALDTLIAFLLGLTLLLAPPSRAYPTDAISFAHADAALVLSGANPYTADAHFPAILAAYPRTLATPLRGRVFGDGAIYPSDARILAVQRRYIADPASEAGAFDPATLHSYPALSFLLYVPLLALGLPNILLLHLLVYAGLFAWLVSLAPPGLRRWSILAAGANAIVLGYAFLGDAQGLCVAFLLLAWHLRKHPIAGPILLGLACAYRQYCWFFVPFFLLAWAFEGRRIHPRRLVFPALVTLAAFLLPNLPYIVASPSAWFASLWLPMTDPMFPAGMGFDALAIGHLLPYIPSPVYAALEALALAAALWAAWRWADRLGDGVLLLALAPLLFAFRSLPNYFAVAPWLALYAVNRYYAARAVIATTSSPAPASVSLAPAPQLLPEATP